MIRDDAQVVVLAGGLGTRLGAAGRQCPKVLQPVHGRPFLDIMLGPLLDQGFRRFCFCLGYLSEQVVAHIGREWNWLRPSFHVDREPLGTGGALLAARPVLDETFLVVLGDTYLDLAYRDLLGLLGRAGPAGLGVMAVTDAVAQVPGNVEVAAGRVARYDKSLGRRTRWVDTGALALRRSALDLVATGPYPVDLGSLFRQLTERSALLAYPVHCPFYDIGTIERLSGFADLVASGRTARPTGPPAWADQPPA